MDGSDGCTMCEYIYNAIVLNIYWKMFKMVNFMLYIFTTIKNE